MYELCSEICCAADHDHASVLSASAAFDMSMSSRPRRRAVIDTNSKRALAVTKTLSVVTIAGLTAGILGHTSPVHLGARQHAQISHVTHSHGSGVRTRHFMPDGQPWTPILELFHRVSLTLVGAAS
jgi:hypothetical protein